MKALPDVAAQLKKVVHDKEWAHVSGFVVVGIDQSGGCTVTYNLGTIGIFPLIGALEHAKTIVSMSLIKTQEAPT